MSTNGEVEMFSHTTELALAALQYLYKHGDGLPVPREEIATHIGASPSYLAKVIQLLSKARITRSLRGATGGIMLIRPLDNLTLLEVMEICQGKVLPDNEGKRVDPNSTCAYHQATGALHEAITKILTEWTVKQLAEQPRSRTVCDICKSSPPPRLQNG